MNVQLIFCGRDGLLFSCFCCDVCFIKYISSSLLLPLCMADVIGWDDLALLYWIDCVCCTHVVME